jgi:hypothetical protein
VKCEEIRSLNQESRVPALILAVLQLQILTKAADVVLCVNTDFPRSEHEIFAPLKRYTKLTGIYLPTSWNNHSVPSSRVKHSKEHSSWTASILKMAPTGCPETSVTIYKSTVRNTPEERESDMILIRIVAERMAQGTSGLGTSMSFRVIAT